MKWKEQMQEKINNHMKIIDICINICGLGIILGDLIIGTLIGIGYLGMGRIKEFVITFIVNVVVLSAVMTALICHKSGEEELSNEDIVNIVGFIFLMIFMVLPLTVMTISTIKDLVNQ